MKIRAEAALDAVIRPQCLLAIGHGDRLERLAAGMAGRKARMAGRMPVLRQHDMFGIADHVVDQRHDLVAAGNRQRAAGAEIVLQVDDDERFASHEASLWAVLGACSSEKVPRTRPDAET